MITRPDVLRYRVAAQLPYLMIILKADLAKTYDSHLHKLLRKLVKINKQEIETVLFPNQ